MAALHHHFELAGWHESKVVIPILNHRRNPRTHQPLYPQNPMILNHSNASFQKLKITSKK